MNKILDLKKIILFLKESSSNFRIFLFQQKTNYNVLFKCLYLNYKDLPQIEVFLKEMKNPPFQIKVDKKLSQKYNFDLKDKILYLQELPTSHNVMFTLNQRLRKQVLSSFELKELN